MNKLNPVFDKEDEAIIQKFSMLIISRAQANIKRKLTLEETAKIVGNMAGLIYGLKIITKLDNTSKKTSKKVKNDGKRN